MSEVARRLASATRPLVVAHRGDWSGTPENSRAAIRAARAFDVVEIDVRIAADGVPVIMHDASCLRTTGRDLTVSEHAAADLGRVPLLGGDETVPTLDEALGAGGPDLFFDLDVKDPADLPAVAAFMAGRAERSRCHLKADVAQPGDIDALLALQARADTCVIAKLVLRDTAGVRLLDEMRVRGVAAAEVWFQDLATLRRAVATGLPLTTYTLRDVHCAGLSDDAALSDPDAVWGTLADAGLRAIMTDEPARLSDYLHGRRQA